MRRSASAILLAMGWASCTMAGPGEAPLPRVAPGQSVSLKVGEAAQSADGSLRFGFEAVTADSRCPRNVQCVWAGDATVRIWLQRGSAAREWRDLHSNTGSTREGPDPGLRLERLEPVPVAGQELPPRHYIATLVLSPPPPVR